MSMDEVDTFLINVENVGRTMFDNEKDNLFIRGTNIPIEWVHVNGKSIYRSFWLSRGLK